MFIYIGVGVGVFLCLIITCICCRKREPKEVDEQDKTEPEVIAPAQENNAGVEIQGLQKINAADADTERGMVDGGDRKSVV